MTPALTVAVPTVRRPALLAETLRALLAQDEPSLEILVSDNGSGDGTPEVVARLADPRLRFRQNPATVPMVPHWNQVLAEARGEWFVIVSDDDLVNPGFAGALLRAARAGPETALVLSRFQLIDGEGRELRGFPGPAWSRRPGSEYLLDWLCRGAGVAVPTLVSICAPTALLRRLGGYPDFPGGLWSDNAAAVALALCGEVAFAGEALLRYRVYPGSANLSAPWERLAQASGLANAWLAGHPPVAERLAALPPPVSRRLRRGFARMLRREYQSRLLGHYLPALGLPGALRAAWAYPGGLDNALSLPRFAGKAVRRRLLGG